VIIPLKIPLARPNNRSRDRVFLSIIGRRRCHQTGDEIPKPEKDEGRHDEIDPHVDFSFRYRPFIQSNAAPGSVSEEKGPGAGCFLTLLVYNGFNRDTHY